MGRKELKQQNKDMEIHVVDILSKFDPSETGKFTKFLLDTLKNHQEPTKGRLRLRARPRPQNGFVRPTGKNKIEEQIISYLTEVFTVDNLETLIKFHNHLENDRIDINKRDINQYNNWDELNRVVSAATIKLDQKRLEKEVIKVLETEEWLAIRPLTIESSLTYGAGTKWCTAAKNDHDYFYRYSQKGVLTYVINKKTGDKYGVMYDLNENSGEFSVWNAPDKRIDSVESTIPQDIMREIYQMSKTEKNNLSYFSDEEYKRAQNFIGLSKSVYAEEEAVPMAEDWDMEMGETEELTPMDMNWGVQTETPMEMTEEPVRTERLEVVYRDVRDIGSFTEMRMTGNEARNGEG